MVRRSVHRTTVKWSLVIFGYMCTCHYVFVSVVTELLETLLFLSFYNGAVRNECWTRMICVLCFDEIWGTSCFCPFPWFIIIIIIFVSCALSYEMTFVGQVGGREELLVLCSMIIVLLHITNYSLITIFTHKYRCLE